ncbi:MAG: SIMPL domain-containing protein [Alphaproteobacteria bacterium]|nr:SIMPL domain-containing protein [Alphaproteobacteria bacterium]
MRWISLAAIAALALLIAPATAQQSEQVVEPARGAVLNITASGLSTAAPDMATVSLGVATQGTTAAEAVSENALRMTALLRALRQSGVAERDIQTTNVRVSPRYRPRQNLEPLIIGYDANNSVRAEVRDINQTGRVVDAAVAAGGNTVQGIVFSHQDPEAQLNLARRDAMRMARARADLYAEAAGLRVRRIISISEAGAFAPTFNEEIVLTATRRSADYQAITPIAAGDLEIRANVSVSFELR